jgi:hypothetical protein
MAAAVYKSVVLDAMYDLLASHGFRKRASSFKRDVADVVHLVQLQSSTKSTTDVLIATVNVGIFSRALEHRLKGPITDPTEADCHWRQRLGHLSPQPNDLWWEMRTEAAALTAAADVAAMIRDFALPALEHLSSTASLQALWASGRSPGLTEPARRRFLQAISAT